ncbi:MAG TPA: porin family protein, partial [Xanthobacteraceae bacterium]|nr:porin family protein [Xanthobacteraceae bacterium]
MRKLLLSAAATILIAGPAFAADLGVRPPPAAPAFIATPWDGFYIGGNLGYGSTDFTATEGVAGVSDSTSLNGAGVLGGFQTGYNKQFGTFVLGFETDLDLTSIKNTTDGVDTKLTWFGTTRTRAG